MRFAGWAAALAALAWGHPLLAQSNQVAAEALFNEGRRLMNEGKYAEACPKLAESQRLDPGTGTLLNLATCYEKNEQTASAWVTYKSAASSAQSGGQVDRARLARDKAAELEQKLIYLKVVVGTPASGLEIKRDGVAIAHAEWGVAIPVDPGKHPIEAYAPGKRTWSTTVDARVPKETVTVEVPPLEDDPNAKVAPAPPPPPPPATSATAAPPPPPPPPPPPSSTQKWFGFGVLGLGVVGVGIGSFFGLQAMSKNDDAESRCPTVTTCDREGAQASKDASDAATVSTILFAAGGALAAGGVVLLLTAPRAKETAIRVSPTVGGLVLRGAF